MRARRYAFAAVMDDYIDAWSVRPMAAQVREDLGARFDHDGTDWRKGWKEALKNGYRVRKILISEV